MTNENYNFPPEYAFRVLEMCQPPVLGLSTHLSSDFLLSFFQSVVVTREDNTEPCSKATFLSNQICSAGSSWRRSTGNMKGTCKEKFHDTNWLMNMSHVYTLTDRNITQRSIVSTDLTLCFLILDCGRRLSSGWRLSDTFQCGPKFGAQEGQRLRSGESQSSWHADKSHTVLYTLH